MNVFSFILQRSFARYVALDLLSAARALGYTGQWVDIEGRLNPLISAPPAQRAAGVAALVADLQRVETHLVLSYGVEYLAPLFHPVDAADRRTLAGLIGSPAAYFFFDFGLPFDRPPVPETQPIIEALQSPDSLVYTWDRITLDVLTQYGVLSAGHFPMAVNPDMFTPAANPGGDRDIPVIFAGGPADERLRTLAPLADLGLQIFGYDEAGWAAVPELGAVWHPPLLDRREMAAAYARARIAVNVTRPHGPASLNMRVYEAMAAGCLMITDDRADVHALFVPGEHLVVYRSPEHLRALVQTYLTNDAERARIAEAGQREVESRHTYVARLRGERSRLDACYKRAALCRRLETMAVSDPGRALALADFIEEQVEMHAYPDYLPTVRSTCYDRLGDTSSARKARAAAFEANPSSWKASRAALAAGDGWMVPSGHRSVLTRMGSSLPPS